MKRTKAPKKLVMLTYPGAEKMKRELYRAQKGVCPILKKSIPYSQATLDHKHKTKPQKAGPKGRGLIRGVISNQANVVEGLIHKKYKRQGIAKYMGYIEFLENLLEYIKNPPVEQIYVHPADRPPAPRLTKIQYNRVVKYWPQIFPRRPNIPEYPKSGLKKVGKPKKGEKQKYAYKAKLTTKWERWLKKADEIHFKGKKK